MRRIARLVASIMIVLAIIGQSFAFRARATAAASDRNRVVDALAAPPLGEVRAEPTERRLSSAPGGSRGDWTAIGASLPRALVNLSIGRFGVAPATGSIQLDAGRAVLGRAPPVSC